MGRRARVQERNGIYHVFARGNRDSALFLHGGDRRLFLAIVGLIVAEHEWDLHSFCLLTTHYHLLFTTPRGDLAAGMHRINSRYAHWFNDEHLETGHVFRSRYGSVPVRTDEHLRWLYHYIAYNPVKAGMCARPEDWRWSSYAAVVCPWTIDLPASEHSLLRHFGRGERGRRALRRCVEREVAPPPDLGMSRAWHRTVA
jgi:REP element-mobilizing transposase RayT